MAKLTLPTNSGHFAAMIMVEKELFMGRRFFSDEFRQRAVRLARQPGCSIGSVAAELGVTPASIRNWLRAQDVASSATATTHAALTAQIRLLQAENQRLSMEYEILKKATEFFSKPQP